MAATRSSEHARRFSVGEVAPLLGLAALYFVTGRLGLELADYHESATLIWPPTGISLAALILFGRRLWPGVWIGAFAVNMSIGTSLGTSLCIATGNTLEALTGLALLTLVARFDPGLARLRDVIAFIVLGVVISTTVSATIGLAALWSFAELGGRDPWIVWSTWWLGDVGGAVVFAPALMVGLRGTPTWKVLVRRTETWAVLVVLFTILLVAFADLAEQAGAKLVFAMLAVPFLVWGGLRLGPRGAMLYSLVTAIVASAGTMAGMGPFAGHPTEIGVRLLWAYVTTTGAVAMILAAAIAERSAAEQARLDGERQRADLESVLRERQRLESLAVLAGGIAHDFNNLLAVIRGNADLVRHEIASSMARESLDDIDAATRRAAQLCDQLLTYAGKNAPQTARVDLPRLLQESRALLGSSVPSRIELKTRMAADVLPVCADATQIERVITNLVNNAVDAIGEGSGTIVLEVGVVEADLDYLARTYLPSEAPPGTYVYIEVRDDGPGMPKAQMDRLFDPFYTTRFEGRGLGLASVLGIVQSHGGAVKVRSSPGQGAAFRVLLPPFEHDRSTASKPTGFRPYAVEDHPGTVLVADDDDMVRRVTVLSLQRAGWVVLAARDGHEAVTLFERHLDEVDALVLDQMMPRLSGIGALKRMRQLRPDVPALIVTGNDMALREHDDVVVDVLLKPHSAAELRRRLASITRHARQRASDTEEVG